jgi:uncharacterized protein (TIGR00297 family)
MTLSVSFAYGWASSSERLTVAAGVTVAFALVARALRGVNLSGALAGGLACFVLFAGVGPVAFLTLAALFAMTWVSTRLGYRRKLALGVAERRDGRNAWQVLANLIVAACGAIVFAGTGNRAWLIAVLAAFSEAATDTVASEIGQYRGANPRFITSWQVVAPGTDGGITIVGSVAGLAAGVVITAIGVAGGMIHFHDAWIPVVTGFAGMLIDSLIGATFQRRGWISNQTVNFVSTLAAAALAYAISMLNFS